MQANINDFVWLDLRINNELDKMALEKSETLSDIHTKLI